MNIDNKCRCFGMNQEKMGQLIAELRKEKKLTQEKFAEILNVDRTTISKWERGISAPDISLLQPICTVFDITVSELLNYEKGVEITSEKDNTIDAIKYYNKKTQKKYVQIFVIVLLFIVGIFITGITVNNYNKYEVYEIESNNTDFFITGYSFRNKKNEILFIKSINYNSVYVGTTKEITASKLKINLISNSKVLYSSQLEGDNEAVYIDELLNNISFYYDSSKAEEPSEKNNVIDNEKLFLNIEVYNIDNELTNAFNIKLILN